MQRLSPRTGLQTNNKYRKSFRNKLQKHKVQAIEINRNLHIIFANILFVILLCYKTTKRKRVKFKSFQKLCNLTKPKLLKPFAINSQHRKISFKSQ